MQDLKRAALDCTEAIAIQPGFAEPWDVRGRVRLERGDPATQCVAPSFTFTCRGDHPVFNTYYKDIGIQNLKVSEVKNSLVLNRLKPNTELISNTC